MPTMQTTLDLRGLMADMGLDVETAFAQLRQFYIEVDARLAERTAGLELPCHRGCSMCCHESVFVTPLEFFYTWDWAQSHLDEATRAAIVERGLALYRLHQTRILALQVPPPDGARDHLAVARLIRFTCPLLGPTGACQVYPVRELNARLFGSTFFTDDAIYGCHLVSTHLAGRVVTLPSARALARRLGNLPWTETRQVYPYYFNLLYGDED